MASTKTIEHRKAVLRAKGVPERFIEALATRNPNGLLELLGLLVAAACLWGAGWLQMTALPFIVAWLCQALYGNLPQGVFFSPGAMFDVFSLLGVVCPVLWLFFAGVALRISLFPERVRPWPAYNATAAALRMLGRNQTLKTTKPRLEFRQLGHLTSEVAFLEAVIRNQPRHLFKAAIRITIVLACLAGVLGGLCTQDYVRVTDRTVEVHHVWGTHIVALNDIKRAETSCVDTGKERGFHYVLDLPNQKLELYPTPSAEELNDRRDVLMRLGRVDTLLRRREIADLAVGRKDETIDRYNACLSAWRLRMKVDDLSFPPLLPTSKTAPK